MDKNQNGFGLIWILLAVIAFCLILYVGWGVYLRNHLGSDQQYHDSVEVTYERDGTYKSFLHSDYVDTYEGKWKLIKTPKYTLLYQVPDGTSNFQHSPTVRVIYDGEVLDGLGTFESATFADNPAFKDNVEDVEFLKKSMPAYEMIVNRTWQKSGEQDAEFRPMGIVFHDDGTYTGLFKNGCTHTAPWNLTASASTVGITFEEYDYCDSRESSDGKNHASNLQFTVKLNKLEDENYDYNSYVNR